MTETVCEECKIGKLQARQYNYEEVIFLCNNKTCAWPLYPNVGQDLADFIVKRKSSDIDLEVRLPKKRQKLEKSVENENQSIVLEEDSLDELLKGVNTLGQELDLSEIFGDISCSDNNLDVNDTSLDFSLFKEDAATPGVDASSTPSIGPAPCIPVPTRDAETETSVASAPHHLQSNHQPRVPPTPDDMCKSTPDLAQLSTTIPIYQKKAKKATRSKGKPVRIAAVNGESETKNGNTSTSGPIEELDVCDIPFDERGSIHACICLLVHSHHILQLKGMPGAFIRKLVSYYATRIMDPNVQGMKYDATWTAIKRCCSEILNKRKTSVWKQGQRLPACVLSDLVRTPVTVNKLFKCDVRSEISCTNCGKKIVSIDTKTFHIMEKVPDNFTITKACCFTRCSVCGADNQKKFLTYYMLPDVLVVQFSSGLPDRAIMSFDFVHQGYLYKVTEVVQHEAKSDRFIAWTRNYNDDSWVRHNNFHDQPVKCGTATLDVPPSECHLLIWEKCDPSTRQETSQPLRTAANNLRTKIISLSVPNSPCKFSPLVSLPSQVKPAKEKLITAQEKRVVSIPKSTAGVRTYSFLGNVMGKTNVFGFEISRHSDELDDPLPSPSNSETSNASDGDVTIANSSFFASLRNNRDSTQKPFAGYPWVAQSLATHRRQWTEFKSQPQRKRTVRKTRPEKPLPVVRKDSTQVQKLLAGTEIFLS